MDIVGEAALSELLRCPIEWHSVCPEEELCYWLNYVWFGAVRRHKVDNEEYFFSSEDWKPSTSKLSELDPRECQALATNINAWGEGARSAYVDSFRGLRDLRVATSRDFSKHYCQSDYTDEEVAARSVSIGEGVLYPRITVEWQKGAVWSALLELWETHGKPSQDVNDLHGPDVLAAFESIFITRSLTIAREFPEPIGCCRGESSRFGVLKYDFSAAQVHMYPVSSMEANQCQFQVSAWLFH